VAVTEAELVRDIQQHKLAIRQHRQQLQRKAAALAEMRRRCNGLGIGFTVVESPGDAPVQESTWRDRT
jgi:hypothetical protein